MIQGPKPETRSTSEQPENPKTLARFDSLERKMSSLTKNVGLVQNTNWLIVIVLFVALIAIAFTAIFTFIQAIQSDTASRSQLTQSVNDLKTEIEIMKGTQALSR